MAKEIYLDYAAATPMDPEVLRVMEPYFIKWFHNPSATYLAGQQARRALNEARAGIAKWLGTRPAEIVFTAGATEANNLAIAGIMRHFPGREVLVSSIEHESVLAPASHFKNQLISVTKEGVVDLKGLEKQISDTTVLVSVMWVNNELGTLQPLREIGALIQATKQTRRQKGSQTPLYFHTDAAQAGNYFNIQTNRTGVDLLSLNGSKLYAPKQTGVLYVKAGTVIEPLIVGGGQESGLRSGTENVAGAIGLAKALEVAQTQRPVETNRVRELRDLFIGLLKQDIPAAMINGSKKQTAPHILHVTFPGIDNERLMMELDENGIQCAVGSACSAANEEPSHVLSAIGLSGDLARSSLRFSFGRQTTAADIKRTVEILSELTAVNR